MKFGLPKLTIFQFISVSRESYGLRFSLWRRISLKIEFRWTLYRSFCSRLYFFWTIKYSTGTTVNKIWHVFFFTNVDNILCTWYIDVNQCYWVIRKNKQEKFAIPVISLASATLSCLSKVRTWIFNDICRGIFMYNKVRRDVIGRFVDIGGIV